MVHPTFNDWKLSLAERQVPFPYLILCCYVTINDESEKSNDYLQEMNRKTFFPAFPLGKIRRRDKIRRQREKLAAAGKNRGTCAAGGQVSSAHGILVFYIMRDFLRFCKMQSRKNQRELFCIFIEIHRNSRFSEKNAARPILWGRAAAISADHPARSNWLL